MEEGEVSQGEMIKQMWVMMKGMQAECKQAKAAAMKATDAAEAATKEVKQMKSIKINPSHHKKKL